MEIPESARTLLAELHGEGRTRWPDVALDVERFSRYVVERCPVEELMNENSSARVHATDLFLACACAHGVAHAVEAFERELMVRLSDYLTRIDRSPAFVDEVRQVLRTKLFTASGGEQPKIHDYTGRGPLGAWVRVAAVRTGLNLRRRTPEEIGHSNDFAGKALQEGSDPELEYIKGWYREDFQAAFQAALLALPSQSRTLLRLHYVDGLNLEKLAALYRIGRSTAHRWIAEAREQLFAETSRILRERLRLTAGELESLIGLVRSQLHVSLSRLLEKSASG
jgi:RNA polymerase sigma-70 factor (ECF subfamily)